MTRIMMLGDVHGNFRHMQYIVDQACKFDVDLIFQLGDWGFWEHTSAGVEFNDRVEELLNRANLRLIFIDGNHENHALLRSKYIDPWVKAHPNDPLIPIRKHIFHAPRGRTWVWDGVKFLSMGGAFSIDRGYRSVGTSFWFEEVITDAEADEASKVGKVDIVVSHDVPAGISVFTIFAERGQNYTHIRESEYNRQLLRRIVEEVRPEYLFHGHYHVNYKEELILDSGHVIKIRGLNCDGTERNSFTIIDLKEDLTSKDEQDTIDLV